MVQAWVHIYDLLLGWFQQDMTIRLGKTVGNLKAMHIASKDGAWIVT